MRYHEWLMTYDKCWQNLILPQNPTFLVTLSQIVRIWDDFWLSEWWQVMMIRCWETNDDYISTLIFDKTSRKTLLLRALFPEIVAIPKWCRFQKRSKTTSRTIQRLLPKIYSYTICPQSRPKNTKNLNFSFFVTLIGTICTIYSL